MCLKDLVESGLWEHVLVFPDGKEVKEGDEDWDEIHSKWENFDPEMEKVISTYREKR